MIWEPEVSRRRLKLSLLFGVIGVLDACFGSWTPLYPWAGWIPAACGFAAWLVCEAPTPAWKAWSVVAYLLNGFALFHWGTTTAKLIL